MKAKIIERLAFAVAAMLPLVSMAEAATVPFSFGEVKVDCEERDGWKLAFSREVAADGAEIAKIVLDCPEAKTPPKTRLSSTVPQVGMDYAWNVNTGDCSMRPNWGTRSHTEVAQGMPVFVYFDGNDTSHFSVAAESDTEVVIGLYDDGRVVDVPEGKKAFVMNASGKDSFVIRRGGKLSEVSCKSGDWVEL